MSEVEVDRETIDRIEKIVIRGERTAPLFGMAYNILRSTRGELVEVIYREREKKELVLYMEVSEK